MRLATESEEELRKCQKRFEKWMGHFSYDLSKRRDKNQIRDHGLYLNETTLAMWWAWRACWDILKT